MPLSPGYRLDAYEIVRPLGSGGMGEVWLATEMRLGRKVALKVLPEDLTRDPLRVQRFEQEARAASALSHPNVCTILALGETSEGEHYIAMEYVEGEMLRKRISTSRLSIREALDIAIQVAAALTAAHAAGITHRDIKPENVMLRPDGFVKVLDFGLAKLALAGPERAGTETTRMLLKTDAGVVVGTAAYMSPEQARGQEVDARTDIWSLGVLLYEMVAGRGPFAGPSGSDVLAAILQNEPPPVARFEPDAPAELHRILSKTLRKDRAQRYQTVQDLLLDLQALRDEVHAPTRLQSASTAVTAATADGSARGAAEVRPRNRRAGRAAAAAVLVLGAALGVWAWRTARPAQTPAVQRDTAVQHSLTRLTFGPGLQSDVTFSSDGRFIAYGSDRAGNFDIWVQPVAGGEPVQITKSREHETQPDWSPDSSMIAYRSEADGGGIHAVPALGGAERRLAKGGYRPRFSPDGRSVMFLSSLEHETTNVARPDVYLVPSGGGAPRRLFERFWDQVGAFYHIDWHPDGARVSFTGVYANVTGFFTVPVNKGNPVASPIPQGLAQRVAFGVDDDAASDRLSLREFRWSPTGTRVLFSGSFKGLQNLWSIDVDPVTLGWLSRAPARVTAGSGADDRPTLSADGQRIAFTVRRETTRVWVIPFDDRRGKTQGDGQPLSPDDFTLTNFDLSRDGRKLAFVGWLPGAGRRQLWEVTVATGESRLRLSDDLTRGFIRYSRSAHALAFDASGSPRTLRILSASALEERVVAHAELMFPFDWTPDETAIIGSAADGTREPWYVAAWPIAAAPHAENSVTVILRDPDLSLWGARYSPDGAWLCFNAHGTRGTQSSVWPLPVGHPTGRGRGSPMENGGQINRGGHLTGGRCTTSAAPKEASSTCTGCGSIRRPGERSVLRSRLRHSTVQRTGSHRTSPTAS